MLASQSAGDPRGLRCFKGKLAGAAGLEPATGGFGDRCSTKLSYTPAPLPSTPGASRTHDTRFRKPLLYPLSYRGPKWR